MSISTPSLVTRLTDLENLCRQRDKEGYSREGDAQISQALEETFAFCNENEAGRVVAGTFDIIIEVDRLANKAQSWFGIPTATISRTLPENRTWVNPWHETKEGCMRDLEMLEHAERQRYLRVASVYEQLKRELAQLRAGDSSEAGPLLELFRSKRKELGDRLVHRISQLVGIQDGVANRYVAMIASATKLGATEGSRSFDSDAMARTQMRSEISAQMAREQRAQSMPHRSGKRASALHFQKTPAAFLSYLSQKADIFVPGRISEA